MTQSKHTPTPWELSSGSIWGKSLWNARVKIAETTRHSPLNGIEAQDNAEFIVRACNAHDDLVAALEKIAGVNDVDGNSMECEDHEACQEVAIAALAKAKGE